MKRKSGRIVTASPAKIQESSAPLVPPGWQKPLQISIIVISVLMGCYFRLYHLDYKTYWFDEIRTMLTLCGKTYNQAARDAFGGKIVHAADLIALTEPEKTVGLPEVTKCIAAEGIGATHPPLFFVLAKLWQYAAGTDPARLRLLAAIFGILALPAGYLLAKEVFDTPVWALALMSVSPLLVLMAQEARNYSLWILCICLSGYFLLRSLRTNEKRDWISYTAACAAGLYTHYMMILVIAGFAISVLLEQGKRITETTKRFAIASGAAFACLAPWLVLVLCTASTGNGYTSSTFEVGNYPGMFYVSKYFANAFRIFWDVDMQLYSIEALIGLIVFGLECWSAYYVIRFAPRRGKLFASALLFAPFLLLMLADFIGSTILSTVARYLIPSAMALMLTLSYFLSDRASSGNRVRRITAVLIACMLVGLECYSCFSSAQQRSWWTRQIASHELVAISQVLNSQQNPVFIATNSQWTTFGEVMTLSRLLSPKVQIILSQDNQVPDLPAGQIQAYLLEPSAEFINNITGKYHCICKSLPNSPGLFQLLPQ